jgi:hypothetical protein
LFTDPSRGCDPNCNLAADVTTFSLTRLTESRLSNCKPGANLSVNAFTTDGAFVAPPAQPSKRVEFVGEPGTAVKTMDD